MLQLHVKEKEVYDEKEEVFIQIPSFDLELEHSLISLSKWESKYKKHLFGNKNLTEEDYFNYARCMSIKRNVPDSAFRSLSSSDVKKIVDYIEDPHTATTISHAPSRYGRNHAVTSEVIYSWMMHYNIPMECQKWHLNRLLTLIQVREIHENPNKEKIPRNIAAEQQRALNKARKAQYKTRG